MTVAQPSCRVIFIDFDEQPLEFADTFLVAGKPLFPEADFFPTLQQLSFFHHPAKMVFVSQDIAHHHLKNMIVMFLLLQGKILELMLGNQIPKITIIILTLNPGKDTATVGLELQF